MILDTKKTYIHKKTKCILKIASLDIAFIGKSKILAVEVCEIMEMGHKFLCPLTEIEEK